MKHHFGDFLDREGDYWTVVPNRERFTHEIDRVRPKDPEARIVLVSKHDEDWKKCLDLPNLDEVTLHEPSHEQFEAICRLEHVKRLRITHFRPKQIEAISRMAALEELVLEYVSGFSDLSPLAALPKLRALHMENLRRVSDFSGLAGCNSLRYLSIFGTLDWDQPIDGFQFLRDLPALEVFSLAFVKSSAPYPAFLPAAGLAALKKLRIAPVYFDSREYALLSVMFPAVSGTDWGGWRKMSYSVREGGPADDWFEFTGKRAGRVKYNAKDAAAKCAEADRRYAAMQDEARMLLDSLAWAR